MSGVIVKGFQVVEPDPASGRVRMLSRVYTIKDAAVRFATLARSQGHEHATVESILKLKRANDDELELF